MTTHTRYISQAEKIAMDVLREIAEPQFVKQVEALAQDDDTWVWTWDPEVDGNVLGLVRRGTRRKAAVVVFADEGDFAFDMDILK